MIKKSVLEKLFDMNDTTVSASTVFMIITSIISCILLLVPVVILIIEVCYNHTITTDLHGMAAYIGASATIASTGGLIKGWSTWSNYKYNKNKKSNDEKNELEM